MLNKEQNQSVKTPFIRTMEKDMNTLSNKVVPPPSLPVVEKKKLESKPKVKIVKKLPLKFILVSLICIIIFVGIGGFFYWWNYVREVPVPATYSKCENLQCVSVEGDGEDQCSVDQDCQPVVKPAVIEPLIIVSSTSIIIFESGQGDSFQNKLKSVVNQKQTNDSFEWITIKESGLQQEEYLSLSDLLTVLNLNFPINVLGRVASHDVLSDNYTLFSFSQTQGNHLGMVIKLKQELDLTEILKLWESTITADLKPLLLMQEIPASFTETFQDNIYKDIAIRYMNFSEPDLSIDYAVVADKLVIATSRKAMYAAIDALLGE